MDEYKKLLNRLDKAEIYFNSLPDEAADRVDDPNTKEGKAYIELQNIIKRLAEIEGLQVKAKS
jgi:hypothetical protein